MRGGECKAMDCPALLPPAHGYFLRNECKNVFNAACGVRCHSGYQVGLGISITYFKTFISYLALASDYAFPLVHGVESRPSARLKRVGQCNRPPTAMSPAPHTTMKLTPPASLGRQAFYPKAFPLEIFQVQFWLSPSGIKEKTLPSHISLGWPSCVLQT